jgi:hypothetical protein
MHPKPVPSIFLLGATTTTMETTDSPDKQIVGANGIPRACMSFPQGSVAPFLNNRKLYIMGVYKYLEFGLFIFGS